MMDRFDIEVLYDHATRSYEIEKVYSEDGEYVLYEDLEDHNEED